MTPPPPDRVECRLATLIRDASGIIWVDQVRNGRQTREDAMEITLAMRRMQPNGRARSVVLMNAQRVDRGARHVYAGEEGEQTWERVALVLSTKLGEVTGNFFLRVNRPLIPVRLFTDRDQAVAWLLLDDP